MISGSVFIGTGERDDAGSYVSTTCPLANVQVCLYQLLGSSARSADTSSMLPDGSSQGDREIGCVTTDDAGSYVFNAAIGARVYPTLVMSGVFLAYAEVLLFSRVAQFIYICPLD